MHVVSKPFLNKGLRMWFYRNFSPSNLGTALLGTDNTRICRDGLSASMQWLHMCLLSQCMYAQRRMCWCKRITNSLNLVLYKQLPSGVCEYAKQSWLTTKHTIQTYWGRNQPGIGYELLVFSS